MLVNAPDTNAQWKDHCYFSAYSSTPHPPPLRSALLPSPLRAQSCSRAEAIWYSPKSTAIPERVRVWNRGRNKSYCIEFASPQCVELCEYMSDMSVFFWERSNGIPGLLGAVGEKINWGRRRNKTIFNKLVLSIWVSLMVQHRFHLMCMGHENFCMFFFFFLHVTSWTPLLWL